MRWLAKAALALLGWRADVVFPPSPKCVIIFYPHTSNWDFVLGYLAKVATGLPAHFLGKDSIFRWPFGGLLRRMGGIPVDRSVRSGVVGQLAAEFARRSRLWLALAPEGTRKYTDHWKSGFYRIAVEAKVPLGLAYGDYRTRVIGLRTYLELTGDEEVDLARIRAAYAGKVGRHPEQASDIRLLPAAPPPPPPA